MSLVRSLAAVLLSARCASSLVVQKDDPEQQSVEPFLEPFLDDPAREGDVRPLADPMSLERGAVANNLSGEAGLEVSSASLEMRLRLQAGDCAKNGDTSDHGHASGVADVGVFNRPWTKEMHSLQDSPRWGKLPAYDKAMSGYRVKVAFLMFANDRMNNQELWYYWMDQASRSGLDYNLYIHAYGLPPRGNSSWQSDHFLPYLIKEQVRTTWCQMWEAQMMLLKKAAADKSHTHFMMLSGDSVPVKPMTFIYSELSKQPLSRFCVDDFWRSPWPRAETWSVLRRGDAEFFMQNEAFASRHLRRDCEEELAWYFPLRVRWGVHGEKAALERECIMFTNWKDGEKACKEEWAKNTEKCNCPTLRKGKNISAGFKHPVIYQEVSDDAFEELVRSPFWFARKITDGVISEDLKEMLHENFTAQRSRRKRKRRRFFR